MRSFIFLIVCFLVSPCVADNEFARIKVFSESWCPPCQKFKAEMRPRLLKAGWSIKTVRSDGRPVPTFIVTIGTHTEQFSGYSNQRRFEDRLRKVIQNYKDKR